MSRSPGQRWQRGRQNLAQGQPSAARAQLELLQMQAPTHVYTHLLSSRIAWHEDRVRDAARHALAAAASVPDEPDLIFETVEALLQAGECMAARECLAKPSLAQATAGAVLIRLADYRQRLDEHAESLALIRRAMAAGITGPEIHFHLGIQFYFNGRLREAESELDASVRLAPADGRAALALSRLRTQTAQRNHLEMLASGLQQVTHGTSDHAALEFARYKECEDLGRYDEAWHALARGNELMRMRTRPDARQWHGYVQRLEALCTPERVEGAGDAGDGGPQPIFILGLPRSGSTVLERMLGNHPQITSAGELVDFENQLHWVADTRSAQSDSFLARLPQLDLGEVGRRYLAHTRWRARGKRWFVDKQPPNWLFAGLISAALPQARILHVVRDPMDVCFSNWRTFFGDTYAYSYDLASLAAYFHDYQRMMTHWHALLPGRILDVPYAELVRRPETVLRGVLECCGLEWQPECMDIARNSAPVSTLSAAQVRGALHQRAFEEWRPYAAQLSPLRAGLSEA